MPEPTNRLYGDLAYLWPLLSRPEDYVHEASYWRQVLRGHLGPGRHTILELGVGGGNNLSHLTADFDATAVDLSEPMLAHSRRLNPGVEHHVGDMRSFRIDKKYAAVIIHDAINYMLSEDELRATFATAAAHLDSGGIFVTAPDYTTETFVSGSLRRSVRSDGISELTFIEYEYDPDPRDTTYEYVLLLLIRGKGELRVEHDLHIAGLFPEKRWLQLLDESGFTPEKREYPVHEDGRQGWLLVGVKR